MAYKDESNWNDINELQCLLIMKKLVRAKENFGDFPHGMQADLCKELAVSLEKTDNPLPYKHLTTKVSNYKAVAGYNKRDDTSANTIRLHRQYKEHSVEELERVIIKKQEKATRN